VDLVRAQHPDLPVYVYDAGHAFVAPSGYHADSARLALLRTRAFFHRASGAKEAGA
jgi:carboxymethylenebutenolidase